MSKFDTIRNIQCISKIQKKFDKRCDLCMCKICDYIIDEKLNEKFDIIECATNENIVNNEYGVLCNNFTKMNKNELSIIISKIQNKFKNDKIIIDNEIDTFEFEYEYFVIRK